jgi:hypothetical protein
VKYIIVFYFILLTSAAFSQKVAHFSFGTRGKDSYEEFSFLIRDNARAEIYYRFGKAEEEIKLTYAGRSLFRNRPCFKVRFADGYELFIAPKDRGLRIADEEEHYNLLFLWESDRINDDCVKDELEAIVLIKQYFM